MRLPSTMSLTLVGLASSALATVFNPHSSTHIARPDNDLALRNDSYTHIVTGIVQCKGRYRHLRRSRFTAVVCQTPSSRASSSLLDPIPRLARPAIPPFGFAPGPRLHRQSHHVWSITHWHGRETWVYAVQNCEHVPTPYELAKRGFGKPTDISDPRKALL
ncbi:hypothetical protein H4582DRAFT_2009446 [Lactarius indigo]|nr:hypothetical protein H4582DRAFT_2009446 [Lactarius indigo]